MRLKEKNKKKESLLIWNFIYVPVYIYTCNDNNLFFNCPATKREGVESCLNYKEILIIKVLKKVA